MDSGDSGILTETKFIDHSTFNNTDLTGANFKGTGNIHPGLTIGQDGKFISYKKEPSESESESETTIGEGSPFTDRCSDYDSYSISSLINQSHNIF